MRHDYALAPLGEMREMGMRGVLVYCADYNCVIPPSPPIAGR
jgi:hypothetical protein